MRSVLLVNRGCFPARLPAFARLPLIAIFLPAATLVLACAGACTHHATPRVHTVPALGGWECAHGGLVRGRRTLPTLAIVLTGGAYGEGTVPILDTLRDRSIPASFFVTGDYLQQPDLRPLVTRMLAEGHYVGPHSHSHPLYCSWDDRTHTLVTEAFFREDLERNIADLRALGALPTSQPIYFIPPSEWYNTDQARWARAMNITLFNFTPGSGSNRDWIPEGTRGFVSSAAIAAGILDFERTAPDGLNGFILLLHLGSQRQDKMHAQIPALLDELHTRGYRFVRIDQLLAGAHCESQHDD